MSKPKYRKYSYNRLVRAGCYQCDGSNLKWHGPNAQGVAARHHDATGHDTWVEVGLMIWYGEKPDDPFREEPIPERK